MQTETRQTPTPQNNCLDEKKIRVNREKHDCKEDNIIILQ